MASQDPASKAKTRRASVPPLETRWKPGQSGNPKGRPRTPVEVREIFREATPSLARKLVELASCGDPRTELRAVEVLLSHTVRPEPETCAEVPTNQADVIAALERQVAALALAGDRQAALAFLAAHDPGRWGSLVGKPQVASDTVDTVEFVPLVSAPSSTGET